MRPVEIKLVPTLMHSAESIDGEARLSCIGAHSRCGLTCQFAFERRAIRRIAQNDLVRIPVCASHEQHDHPPHALILCTSGSALQPRDRVFA
jgi:hypothetical protein